MNMHSRWLMALLFTVMGTSGCVHERVYRCNDCDVPVLSGRYGDGSCGPGAACGGPRAPLIGNPLGTLKRKLTCDKGCGNVFWDEWCSDPPDRCDPCDECSGRYLGERCCPPKLSQKVGSFFFGGRTANACGCGDTGCSSCCADGESDAYASSEEPYYPEQTMPRAKMPPSAKTTPKAEPLPAPRDSEAEPMSDSADETPQLPETNREASRKHRPTTRSASLRMK